MPEDDRSPSQPRKTFFDVARPGSVPTNATSKPVVVGHGVSQADPMMRQSSEHDQLLSHQPAHGIHSDEQQDTDTPGAPELSPPDIDAPINPNSIPLDDTEEVVDVSGEDELAPAEETPPVPESVDAPVVARDNEQNTSEPATDNPEPTVPEQTAEEPLPVRGPAAEPQKLLLEHTEDAAPHKQSKPKRSKLRIGFIIVLSVLVVAAIVVDAILFLQYLKLK